ncbi:MAG TPA: trypsin-like serine protease [Thermoanaerobaculia bacterium]
MNLHRGSGSLIVFLVLLCAGAFPATSQSGPNPTFWLVPTTSVFTQVRARDTDQAKSDPATAEISVSGGEHNECDFPELDISKASAQASVSTLSSDPGRLRFKLLTTASARGGHMVRCALGCWLGQCVGLEPTDPPAQAFSRAHASVDLLFSADSLLLPYNVQVRSSLAQTGGSPANVLVRLADSRGTTIAEGPLLNQSVRIPGGPGLSYRITVESIARAAHTSPSQSGGEADVTMEVKLAPIMENTDDPLIGGGEKTDENAYLAVGAILFDDKGHCTGTLIGRQTVLTAAHCVYNYPPERMTFRIGPNYKNENAKTSAVTEVFYPQFDRDGIQFSLANLEHDIAVVHLSDEFEQFYLLPEPLQPPTLQSLLDERKKLTFVGFGNRVVDGQPTDAGPKRRVFMPISEIQEEKFLYFTGGGASTCRGDSGGPALRELNDSAVVLGIASAGDCMGSGSHVRVEHYLKWIQKFLLDDPAVEPSPSSLALESVTASPRRANTKKAGGRP